MFLLHIKILPFNSTGNLQKIVIYKTLYMAKK